MIISNKHQFIFVKSVKTAGSSIQVALSKVCGEQDLIIGAGVDNLEYYSQFSQERLRIYTNFFQNNPIISHANLRKIKVLFKKEYNDYFKFAFIRNPWDLVVSRYFWDQHQSRHNCNDFNQWLVEKYQFKLWEKDQLHLYTHINNKYKLDFIGRFETLDRDFQSVCEKLNLGSLKLGHEKLVRSDRKHYKEYYSEQSKQIVAKLFKKDIEYFNYTF